MVKKVKAKKRKKVPVKELKMYEAIFDIEKDKGKIFDSCNQYFVWVFTKITEYNKINKTRFKDEFTLKYVSWKSNQDRLEE